MSDNRTANHFSSALFEFLEETFETHHGFYLDKGTSLFEILSTISATEAPNRSPGRALRSPRRSTMSPTISTCCGRPSRAGSSARSTGRLPGASVLSPMRNGQTWCRSCGAGSAIRSPCCTMPTGPTRTTSTAQSRSSSTLPTTSGRSARRCARSRKRTERAGCAVPGPACTVATTR